MFDISKTDKTVGPSGATQHSAFGYINGYDEHNRLNEWLKTHSRSMGSNISAHTFYRNNQAEVFGVLICGLSSEQFMMLKLTFS
jgi:hypothetical protein